MHADTLKLYFHTKEYQLLPEKFDRIEIQKSKTLTLTSFLLKRFVHNFILLNQTLTIVYFC